MVEVEWRDPTGPLAAVLALVRSPLVEMLHTFSSVTAGLVAHDALAMLTGDCSRSPMWTYGPQALTAGITNVELAQLAAHVDVGRPWWGEARLASTPRPVLAVAAAPPGSAGALLAVVTAGADPPERAAAEMLQPLWELTTTQILHRLPEAVPIDQAGPWIANSERARLAADLNDTHLATLTTLLAVLRSRSLDDGAARRTAIDLAASAVVALRASADAADDDRRHEETMHEAFRGVTDMLGLLSRYADVELEYSPLDTPQRLIPADIARASRATARGTVLAMLDQGAVHRIRVSWQIEQDRLLMTIRDDGPGTMAADALAVHRLTDRVVALHGTLHLDSVPGWGTIVNVRLPLAAPDMPRNSALGELNPRELDVLELLVQGHRNRVIAERLHISEHTVKFHVAKILKKLDVTTRGEAAALARAAGHPRALTHTE